MLLGGTSSLSPLIIGDNGSGHRSVLWTADDKSSFLYPVSNKRGYKKPRKPMLLDFILDKPI